MGAAELTEEQQQAIRLEWLPHGVQFELVHPAPWWTALTLPMLLAWVPVTAAIGTVASPAATLRLATLLALPNLAVVCLLWYRDARRVRWRVEATPHRVRVFDGANVRLDAPITALEVQRRASTLFLTAGRQRVELMGTWGVERRTLGWVADRLEQLVEDGRSAPPVDSETRRQLARMADHAHDG